MSGLYATFAGIGLVSAAVLYEPAFADRRPLVPSSNGPVPCSPITLVAGFASTIFLPTTAFLEHASGGGTPWWCSRPLLAAGTVLPYALVLRRDPGDLGLHPDGATRRPSPRRPVVDAGTRDPGRPRPGGSSVIAASGC